MNASISRLVSLAALAICATAVLLVAPQPAQAQEAPGLIPVQGRLLDLEGTPVTDTVVGDFTLYGDAEGTMAIWSEVASVDVVEGYFTTYLGEQSTLDLAIFRDYPTVYLGMVLDGDEMPLVEVAAVPYAGYAAYCSEASTLGGLTAAEIDTLSQLGCAANELAVFDGSAWGCSALPSATTDFGALTGVPADLADGDDDLLASLGCGAGEVAKFVGGAWNCATDLNGTYTAVSPIEITGRDISLAANSVTNAYIAPETITNAEIDKSAAIEKTKIAGTAATLTGSQVFDSGTLTVDAANNEIGVGTTAPEATLDVRGDLQVDGQVRLRTPRQMTLNIAGNTFDALGNTFGENDTWFQSHTGGHLSLIGGTSPFIGTAAAPVNVPAGAVITQVDCYLQDNNNLADITGNVRLYRRDGMTTQVTESAFVDLDTAGLNTAALQKRSDTTIVGSAASTDTALWLFLYWSQADEVYGLRFYGCNVTYTVDSL